MKTLTLFVCLLAFSLVPSPARADGFIDWLEKWSGPKLFGVGFNARIYCRTVPKDGENPEKWFCERLFVTRTMEPEEIKHIVDARYTFYFKYGSRFSDVSETGEIHAHKLMGLYHYRVVPWLDLGGGAGHLWVTGDGFPEEPLHRWVLTPLSLYIAPFNGTAWQVVTLRFESSFITTGFNARTDFGSMLSNYSSNGEWNNSFGIGVDLLRLRRR